LVDVRDAEKTNNRYLINQLLADNGFPDRQIVVMVSDFETMTVNEASPTIGFDGILGALVSAASAPTATPIIAGFDPEAPFGQFNQSLILPFGALAPTLDLVFTDPAAIILPNQHALFVESTNGFLADCGFYANNANSFLNLASGIFTSFNQIAVAQLKGLSGFNLFGNLNLNKDGKKGFHVTNSDAEATVTATETATATDSASDAEQTIQIVTDNPEG
jgi:hypothetical protein